MFIVKNMTNGACMLITGGVGIVITSIAMLNAHTRIGIKIVECDQKQFSRYEIIRKA